MFFHGDFPTKKYSKYGHFWKLNIKNGLRNENLLTKIRTGDHFSLDFKKIPKSFHSRLQCVVMILQASKNHNNSGLFLRFTVAHFEHLKNCHHGSTNLCQTVVILRKDMAGKETHCCRSLDGVSEDLTD